MTFGRSNSFGRVVLLTLFILTVIVVVASFLIVLLMGFGFIFFTSEGLALSTRSFNFPVDLFFFLIGFYTPQLLVGPVFTFLVIVYAFCFVAAWNWRESFYNVLKKSLSRPFRSLYGNFLVVMPLLSSMALTAVWAIIYFQESIGIPTGQPAFPPGTSLQEIFLNLAYAPVVEELGFRLVPLGLFTVFSILLAEKRVVGGGGFRLAAAVFYPDWGKRMAGLRNVREHGIWHGISVAEWTMIIITSVIFAYAHVISPIGWEPGKFTSAFVQGFFFALTYLAYGFEAPILLHWFFDYYLFFFDPEIIAKFFPATDPILSVIESVIIWPRGFSSPWAGLISPLGIFGWTMFAFIGLRKLYRWKRAKKGLMPPTTLPS